MSLKNGVYEQVINEEIKNKIKELDLDKYFLEKETIDAEEAKFISHNRNTPISFVWRLKEEMPAGIMEVVNKGIV